LTHTKSRRAVIRKIIAGIEDPQVIAKIFSHLERTAPDQYQSEPPLAARAPPMQSRLL